MVHAQAQMDALQDKVLGGTLLAVALRLRCVVGRVPLQPLPLGNLKRRRQAQHHRQKKKKVQAQLS